MPRIVLYLLGQKGYQVLNAAIMGGYQDMVASVIVGRDKNVHKDFADEIIDYCRRYGLQCRERTEDSQHISQCEIYTVIAAGWRWLIREPYRQIIVFHDSLLPKYRGFNPLVSALLNHDTEVGVTAIIADKDYDCGDIVDSKSIMLKYPIKVSEAINAISKSYFELARGILDKFRDVAVLSGERQDEEQASYSVWRDDEDYQIDWTNSAESIVHFIDCLSFPYKGASALYEDKRIRILEASTIPDIEIVNRDVGKVIFVSESRPIVICGTGLLRIDIAVDEQGKSVLPFNSFRTRLK